MVFKILLFAAGYGMGVVSFLLVLCLSSANSRKKFSGKNIFKKNKMISYGHYKKN